MEPTNDAAYCKYDINEFSEDELIELCRAHIRSSDVVIQLLDEMEHSDDSQYRPIVLEQILYLTFLDADAWRYPSWRTLRAHPRQMLSIFEHSLLGLQDALIRNNNDPSRPLYKKTRLRIRIEKVPFSGGMMKKKLPRSIDIGKLVSFRGTVVRTGSPKMLEYKRRFLCSKCGLTFEMHADVESVEMFPRPKVCLTEQDPPCVGREFELQELDLAEQDHRDYQEIRVQEQLHQLQVGSMPRSVHVVLMEDLVDLCKAGDDITMTGIVSRRWKPMQHDQRCHLEMIIVCNHLKVNNEQKLGLGMTEDLKADFENFWQSHSETPLKGRDLILKSICPDMFGLFPVKLALALVVAGGVPRRTRDGTKVRGESHLLLVGDPGTGKSQMLKFAAKMASRSVCTTGIGSTGAGLTVTAVKDKGGEWVLEAGALVLADGGICCIDEFNSMQEHDRVTIHEAMEQQTLSIAKAGLVCKLQTRCAILGATNTKNKYDPHFADSLSSAVSIAGPLLSRFDLVMIMLDPNDAKWDDTLAEFILENRQLTAALIAQQQHEALRQRMLQREQEGAREQDRIYQGQDNRDQAPTPPSGAAPSSRMAQLLEQWGLDKLQAYFSYIRAAFVPELTPEARDVLIKYYTKQRNSDNVDRARTTIRMLESLIRLSEAHAKLMFRKEVLVIDAVTAVYIMEASMSSAASLLKTPPTVQSHFPDDPDFYFETVTNHILTALKLKNSNSGASGAPADFEIAEQIRGSLSGGEAPQRSFGGRRDRVQESEELLFASNEGSEPLRPPAQEYPAPSEEWGRSSEHSQASQVRRQNQLYNTRTVIPATPTTPVPVSAEIPQTPSPPAAQRPQSDQQQVFSPPWKNRPGNPNQPAPPPPASRMPPPLRVDYTNISQNSFPAYPQPPNRPAAPPPRHVAPAASISSSVPSADFLNYSTVKDEPPEYDEEPQKFPPAKQIEVPPPPHAAENSVAASQDLLGDADVFGLNDFS